MGDVKVARHASSQYIADTGLAVNCGGAHAAVIPVRKKLEIPSKLALAIRFLLISALTLSLAVVISLSFASAGNNGVQQEGAVVAETATSQIQAYQADDASRLATVAKRDMTAAVEEVKVKEEEARKAAEEAARAEEAATIQSAKDAQARSAANGGVGMYDIDFSIGRDAFIAEWTKRIDNYLAGSPLAGNGSTFAEAAWTYKVDPRWSPAISNTESTKGSNCFASHNAWGWHGGSWSNWSTAINAHVKGLSSLYGFTISYSNAQKYCPPNYDNWYRDTLNEMHKI